MTSHVGVRARGSPDNRGQQACGRAVSQLTGTIGTMATSNVSLVVGMFLGIVIRCLR